MRLISTIAMQFLNKNNMKRVEYPRKTCGIWLLSTAFKSKMLQWNTQI